MSGLLRPQDLNQIATDAKVAKINEERLQDQRKNKQLQELHEAFQSREIQPEAIDRINRAVRIAAEQGLRQVQVLTFPSSFCNDGGRQINIADPEWPSTLTGFARKAFEFYDKELRPHGYKLYAEIISFPGGMPGDVGMFLKW